MLVRPAVGGTIVRLPHQGTLIETTTLGNSLQGLHHNIVQFKEGKLAQLLDINREVASGQAINAVADKISDDACVR